MPSLMRLSLPMSWMLAAVVLVAAPSITFITPASAQSAAACDAARQQGRTLRGCPSTKTPPRTPPPSRKTEKQRPPPAPARTTPVRPQTPPPPARTSPVQPAPSTAASLSGTWQGSYQYEGQSAVTTVKFILEAQVQGTRLVGRISEPNTMTNTSSFLYANVVGTINGTLVRFSKSYDGSGGQSHTVHYEGILDRSSKTVRGQWALPGARGSFEMKLSD